MLQNARNNTDITMIMALAVLAMRGFILDIRNPLPKDPIKLALAEAPPEIIINLYSQQTCVR